MAGRHLRDLIAAYGERDDLKFRRAAQEIIREEEMKRHTVLAKELQHLLASNGASFVTDGPVLPEPPVDRDSALPLARISREDRRLSDLILGPGTVRIVTELLDEVRQWPRLDEAGITRRNRVLLYGPPGNGKTSLAAVLASELGRPLVTVRVEGLISSYLGETAANLARLFEYASSGAFVLFLDEFDSIGKLRDDPSDHGELRRVVNAVLQQIDNYSGSSLIVAATNHPNILDAALWRRFDIVAELPLPTVTEMQRVIERSLPKRSRHLASSYATELAGLPHAAGDFMANAARRRALLRGSAEIELQDLDAASLETISRRWQ
ncbi:ATP-binding protein [Frondihabitans sp. VKM Ac-2883]|uniref:AAA family ATPase n=1 Tax=Frondihabitans sp. VKM Ac-2883 TaxID=2783823 RepID=UPI00188B18E2|nr:ATP-binding protein [Frondihabitans sp. VKM Ac-2883]MBF4575184.1 AAA family ATPase [Frondihabitans sp. VKM Ac-2883]